MSNTNNIAPIVEIHAAITALDSKSWKEIQGLHKLPAPWAFKIEGPRSKANILDCARKHYAILLHEATAASSASTATPVAETTTVVAEVEVTPAAVAVATLTPSEDNMVEELELKVVPVQGLETAIIRKGNVHAMLGEMFSLLDLTVNQDLDKLAFTMTSFLAFGRKNKGNNFVLPSTIKVGMKLIVPTSFDRIIPCVDMLRAVTTGYIQSNGQPFAINNVDFNKVEVDKEVNTLLKNAFKTFAKVVVNGKPKYSETSLNAVKSDLGVALFYANKSVRVAVPSYLAPYLDDLYIADPALANGVQVNKPFNPESNKNPYVFVDTNWIMPATGLSYNDLVGAFKVLENKIQELDVFSDVVSERPITFVEGAKSFEVFFGSSFKLQVTKNGYVFLYEVNKCARHTMKEVAFAARCDDRRNTVNEVVVMSAFDQLFYHFENYLLVDMNRNYVNQPSAALASTAFHASAVQYLLNHAKSDAQVGLYDNQNRLAVSSDSALAVIGAIPGFYQGGSNFKYKEGTIWGRTCAHLMTVAGKKETLTTFLSRQASVASLVLADKASTNKVIKAINKLGKAVAPYGGMAFYSHKWLGLNLATVERNAAIKLLETLYADKWSVWGFDIKFGGFNEETFVAALFDNKAIAATMKAAGLTSSHCGTKEFWDTLAQIQLVYSTKESKLFKRLLSDYFQGMGGANEVAGRLRNVDNSHVSSFNVVTGAILKQTHIDPGMALGNSEMPITGYYTENGKTVPHYVPTENPIAFTEKFAAVASIFGTVGYEFTVMGAKSYSTRPENVGIEVTEGEVIGHFATSIKGGTEILCTPLVAEKTGNLIKLLVTNIKDLSGTYYTTTMFVYEKQSAVNKLRFAQKSNVVSTNFDVVFDLSPEMSHVALAIPADAYKGDDNFNHPWTIIAETFCRAPEGSELRNAILKANQLKFTSTKDTENFYFVEQFAIEGKYQFLLDLYSANFRKSVWYHDRSHQTGYSRIMEMHSNKPGWREVLVTEVFSGCENIPGNAKVWTDATGAIEDTNVVLAMWTEIDANDYVMYHVATRGVSYVGTSEQPLYVPCGIEYISIEQATSITSTTPFSLIALGNRGYVEVAADMISKSAPMLALDKMLTACLNNVIFTEETTGVTPEIFSTMDVRASDVFTPKQLTALALLNDDRNEWFACLCNMQPNAVFVLTGVDMGQVSVHLPTFFELGGRSMNSGKPSICDRLQQYLWLWINGETATTTAMQVLAKDIRVMLSTHLVGEKSIKSQIRANRALYQAAAALSCIPSDEIWVHESHKAFYVKVLGNSVVGTGTELGYVGSCRMPMTRITALGIRFISEEENNSLFATYGFKIEPWRAYFGCGMMYLNWGDLDGDKIALVNMTKYVKEFGVEVDNFDSMLDNVNQTLGYDMLSKEYWTSGKPAQYFGDHFCIQPWTKISAKPGLSASKSIMTPESFVNFQEAAFQVQTVGVGTTYKISAIHSMLAEVLPVVMKHYPEASWNSAFNYLVENNGQVVFSNRLEQIYEVCLGGFSSEVAMVIQGYLVRAVSADTDNEHWSILPEVKTKLAAGCYSNFSSVVPEAGSLVNFTHVPVGGEGNIDDSLEALGFDAGDRVKFVNAAMIAGLCARLGSMKPEDLQQLPAELQLVFSVAQVLLDVSQVKEIRAIKAGKQKLPQVAVLGIAKSLIVASSQAVATLAKGEVSTDEEAAELQQQIKLNALYTDLKASTVTFKLFSAYVNNRVTKETAIVTGQMKVPAGTFNAAVDLADYISDEDADNSGDGNVPGAPTGNPSNGGGGNEEEADFSFDSDDFASKPDDCAAPDYAEDFTETVPMKKKASVEAVEIVLTAEEQEEIDYAEEAAQYAKLERDAAEYEEYLAEEAAAAEEVVVFEVSKPMTKKKNTVITETTESVEKTTQMVKKQPVIEVKAMPDVISNRAQLLKDLRDAGYTAIEALEAVKSMN